MKRWPTVGSPSRILAMSLDGKDQLWRTLGDILDEEDPVIDADTLDGDHASVFERVANKGVASGYASLNASILVVQDPANATATPTGSKIVKAEASGDIALGWIPDTLTGKDADTLDGSHAADFAVAADLCWELDGSNYYVPKVSHPVAPITHQVEELGQSGREWGKLYAKDIFPSGQISIGEAAPTYQVEVHGDGALQMGLFQYSDDAGGASLRQSKARGTKALPTLPNSGDLMGTQAFRLWDGAAWQTAAAIRGYIDGVPALNDSPGRIAFWTTPPGSTTLAEALRIDSLKNVKALTAVVGNDAIGVWALKNTGTAPTSWPSNVAQFGCFDHAAGEACIRFYTEHGDAIDIVQKPHLTALKETYVAGELDIESKIITAINAIAAFCNDFFEQHETIGFNASA